jgi:hypothetical protein
MGEEEGTVAAQDAAAMAPADVEDDGGAARCGGAAWLSRLVLGSLLVCNALMSAAMIGAALVFGRATLYLLAAGPQLMSAALAVLLWRHVCRPRRAALHRVLRWGTATIDAVVLAEVFATVHLTGRFGSIVMAGPVALAAMLTLAVWRFTGRGRTWSEQGLEGRRASASGPRDSNDGRR